MKSSRPLLFLVSALALPFVFLFFAACEIQSGDEVTRDVSISVAGNYTNSGGIPSVQTGQTITQLSLSQNGDQLFAIDNLGARWTGNIGQADTELATITLQGMTSAGVEVVITGTITVSGTSAVLYGTWIEPSIRTDANAQATVAAVITPTAVPTAGVTATPTPVVTVVP